MKNLFFRSAKWNELPADIKDSILQLRHDVFVKELKWSEGLQIKENTEVNQYDTSDATYLYFADESNKVRATCRLIPTTKPYMLKEVYPQAIIDIKIPISDNVWEITRFCASIDLRRETKNKITGILVAAIIEFGLKNNIQNYVALATDSILPVIRLFAGWDPTPIGKLIQTPDDNSYAIIYTVSEGMLIRVKNKVGIDINQNILL